MTAAVFERICDDDMVWVRADGNIGYDSRIDRMLDPDVLERLLTIVSDHIVTDPDIDSDSGAEVVNWGGVEDDCREAGLL